jgi:DNA-directed RNA polymerase subunit beta
LIEIHIIDKDNVEEIIDSNVKSILLHKEDANQADYAIIHNTLQKIQQTLKRSC